MAKRHIKRIAVPRTWNISKKTTKFITKPSPGAHSLKMGAPLSVIFKDILKRANTSKEVKNILNNNEILVDGRRRKDLRFVVGVMDTISIPKTKENFRVIIDAKGKLALIKIDEKEAKRKVCKILNKTKIKGGKTQLNLSGNRNAIIDKDDYKTGDSLLISLPKQDIKEHIKLEKNSVVYLIGGKMVGQIGNIEEIKGSNIMLKSKSKESRSTLKKYAFVIGKEKPMVSVEEAR